MFLDRQHGMEKLYFADGEQLFYHLQVFNFDSRVEAIKLILSQQDVEDVFGLKLGTRIKNGCIWFTD